MTSQVRAFFAAAALCFALSAGFAFAGVPAIYLLPALAAGVCLAEFGNRKRG